MRKKAVTKKAVKKASKKAVVKKAATRRPPNRPRVQRQVPTEVPPEIEVTPSAAEMAENTRCVAAFDIGRLVNEAAWNYDQAMFVRSLEHRQSLLRNLQSLRVIGGHLAAMTTDSVLVSAIDAVERTAASDRSEAEDDHFFAARDEALSPTRDGPPGAIFCDEMRRFYSDIRRFLSEAIVTHMLQTARERDLFRLGILIDSGLRPEHTSRHLFDQVPREAIRSVPSWEEACHFTSTPAQYELRTYGPAETPPPVEWPIVLVALLDALRLDGVPRERPAILERPEDLIEWLTELIDAVRASLTTRPAERITVNLIRQSVTIDGQPHQLLRYEHALYLDTLLRADDWLSDRQVSARLEELDSTREFAQTRWRDMRRTLPHAVMALLETDRARGTRFRPR